ncbi:unnamed protein product [Amoebophrya sp. A120]|nr:unnamed protein product [Amoebophrya sp. A120]|eukprot:GSA120T00013222001.1
MGAAASSALKGPGKGGNKDGEKNKQPSQHQQWRKPKDLKEIKKQNEQRRKEQEELEKRRKEAEEKLRKQKELLEQERKRLETAEEIDGAEVGDYVAGQTTAGNTASSPELSQNNDNYGAGAAGQNGEQNYNFNPDYVFFDDQTGKYIAYDYDEQGNIINMQDVSVHYETAAEKALKKAEQVGIFDIMEHEEVVPSEYVKNQERKEIEERLKQDEMKRSKQNEILQLRQREVKTGSIFGNPKRNSDVLNASQLGSSQKSIGTNNSLRSSQLSLNNTQDKQVLQLQDELVSKHEKLKLPENMSLENTLIDAANKIWEQIIRENKSRRAELNASGGLGPPGSTLTQPQNNTTNATSQRTSTRPSQNNNNSPAKANFGNDLNNPNDPTILLTLKKQVEEAAHSLEAYENDLETYAQQKYALIHELDQLVLKIEPNAILGYNEQLETAYEFVEGEFAIRKGKLCTIHKIHHQELPPYYEVKPYYHNENLTNNFTMNQNIIGTEATKLKALGPVQAGQVRAKMRSIDVIESKVVVADEGKRNAEQDLVMNHKKLEELFQAMKLGKDNPPANPGPPVTLPIPMLPTQPQQPVDLNMTRTRGIAAQNIPRPVSSRPKWKPGMGPVNMPSIEVVKKWAQPGMQDYSPPHNQMESDNVNLNQNYSQNNYGGPGAGQHYNSANPTTQYQYQQVQGGAGIYTSPVTRNSSASNSKEKEKEREQLIFQHGEKMRQEEYMRQEEQRSSRKNSKSQNSVPTTGGFGLPSMEKMQADRAKSREDKMDSLLHRRRQRLLLQRTNGRIGVGTARKRRSRLQ